MNTENALMKFSEMLCDEHSMPEEAVPLVAYLTAVSILMGLTKIFSMSILKESENTDNE